VDCEDDTVLVKVPWDVYAISARDRDLAIEWRLTGRELLGGYLGRGYQAVGLRVTRRGAPPTYVLHRGRS
jgi:predicted GNAT superfamily acetyltransferase